MILTLNPGASSERTSLSYTLKNLWAHQAVTTHPSSSVDDTRIYILVCATSCNAVSSREIISQPINGGPGEALCMHNRMSNSQINNSSANQTAITDNNRHDEINKFTKFVEWISLVYPSFISKDLENTSFFNQTQNPCVYSLKMGW